MPDERSNAVQGEVWCIGAHLIPVREAIEKYPGEAGLFYSERRSLRCGECSLACLIYPLPKPWRSHLMIGSGKGIKWRATRAGNSSPYKGTPGIFHNAKRGFVA